MLWFDIIISFKMHEQKCLRDNIYIVWFWTIIFSFFPREFYPKEKYLNFTIFIKYFLIFLTENKNGMCENINVF